MVRQTGSMLSVFLVSCLLAAWALADAERGIAPKLRGADDPFPAKTTAYDARRLQMECLGRGVVAVRTGERGEDVWVSWRYRSVDPRDVGFNVYRDGARLNEAPITNVTYFVDKGAWRGAAIRYEVRPALGTHEVKHGRGRWTLPSDAGVGCFDIPLPPAPTPSRPPDGRTIGHHANDASVGDVDGDGEYELFVKWESDGAADNLGGYTGETYFDCLKVPGGERLWRIYMGVNMRSGPHYIPFAVADFDCDGKAEMIVRTGPGTMDGAGRTLKDDGTWSAAGEKVEVPDYRQNGQVLDGPEYLTVFDGATGRALDTVKYDPPFENPWIWGDWHKSQGNRSHRFLATTAYLDGVHPSAVMCRGYYARTCLAAWDWDGCNLRERWLFDSEAPRWRGKGFSGQGFHNLRVADIDFDGKDEIVYGQMVVDDDGTGLYTTGMGHGDQIHIVQATPEHVGLQVWTCQENGRDGVVLRDARTGGVIFQQKSGFDVPNCLAADVDPFHPGTEFFAAANIGVFDHTGKWLGVGRNKPSYYRTHRFAVWWLGDMSRSLLADADGLFDYSIRYRGAGQRMKFEGCAMNNGTKGNPCLTADILGDWREEVILRKADNSGFRVYVSTETTPYRFHTLMEDPCYRNSVAAENAGYNVCPEPSFYFGPDLRGRGVWFRGGFIP